MTNAILMLIRIILLTMNLVVIPVYLFITIIILVYKWSEWVTEQLETLNKG